MRGIYLTAKPFLILCIYTTVFYFFHRYDWGHPFVKASCFIILFLMIISAVKWSSDKALKKTFIVSEIVVIALLIIIVSFSYSVKYGQYMKSPARCDIGYGTHDAVKLLVFQHMDPYKSSTIGPVGMKNRKFWGYHYGPAMLFFYLPAAWFSSAALKFITTIYLIMLFGVVALLLHDRSKSRLSWAGSALFAILLMIIPERAWYEISVQGSTDVLPVLLILLSIYFIEKKSFMTAGIFAALSFSAKFSPALFFILLFIRKDIKPRFFAGLLIAGVPLIVYLAWSGMPMFNNMFAIHLVQTFDSTSLYSVTPEYFHFIFPVIQAATALSVLWLNFNKEIETRSLAIYFTLFLIVIDMTYSEVHANHLIWFIPMSALILTWHRHQKEEAASA